MKKIRFRPLGFPDIPLMTHWFNLPHVQEFYSLRSWTEEEVLTKLSSYIRKEKPVSAFMILLDENPVGYLQSYLISDYPWPNQNLPEAIEKSACGMDLFIGQPEWIGKGLGRNIIQSFIRSHIAPNYQYCMVDPDINNIAAIRCYEKLHFMQHAIIESQDALQRPVKLKLMILDCSTASALSIPVP